MTAPEQEATMYGSIFRMRTKPGHEGEAAALFDEWWRERAPGVPGAVAGYVLRPEGAAGDLLGVAVFADRASYQANAADPGQDRWYQRLRDTLEGDPQWEDGEFVSAAAPTTSG